MTPKNEKPWWDDGDIDPGVRDLVEQLNRLPGVTTFESCEGHGEHPANVLFEYWDEAKQQHQMFPHIKRLLQAYKRLGTGDSGICPGCFRIAVRLDAHLDCVEHLKGPWWYVEIKPRKDMEGPWVEEYTLKILKALAEEVRDIVEGR